jgi:hypothetical protein
MFAPIRVFVKWAKHGECKHAVTIRFGGVGGGAAAQYSRISLDRRMKSD